MSAWGVVKRVRFARNSGLLLSCITAEHTSPNTELSLHAKCRSFYRKFSNYESRNRRVTKTHSSCPTKSHAQKRSCCSRRYFTHFGDLTSERYSSAKQLPSINVLNCRCMCAHGQQRRSIGEYDGKKKTKKAILNAGKKIKDRYDEVEEQIRLKAGKVEDRVKGLQAAGKKENVCTVPNLLTTCRIAITPLLGYLVVQEYFGFATCLFGIAGITDMLDGYIARNFANQQSVLGSILDPLADKILVGVLTVTLTAVNLIPIPLTLLIVGRDVLLLSYSFYLRYTSLPPPFTLRRYFDVTHATVKLKPLLISKINTNIQLITVAASLAAPVFGYCDHQYLQALWCLTAGTTFISGLTYLFAKDTFKILSKLKK